jgi:hypothetical protein
VATDAAASKRRPVSTAIGGAVLVGYAAVAGQFATFTRPAEVATFIPGLIGLVVATRITATKPVRPERRSRGWLAWWVVFVAINALELLSLALGANHAHPTISDLVNPWLLHPPGRAVAFAVWLSFGYWLVRR